MDTLTVGAGLTLGVPAIQTGPRVDRVYPQVIQIDRHATLVVQGAGFTPDTRVFLARSKQRIPASTVLFDDSGQLSASFRVPLGTRGPLDLVLQAPSGETTTSPAAILTVTAAASFPNKPTNAPFAFRQINLYANRQVSGVLDHVSHPQWPSFLNSPNLLVQEYLNDPMNPELFDSLAVIASTPYDGVGFVGSSTARYTLQPPQYATKVGLIGMGGFLFNGTTLSDVGKPLLRMVATFDNGDTTGFTLSAQSHIRNWFDGGLQCNNGGFQPFASATPGYSPSAVIYSGPSDPPDNTVHYDFQPFTFPAAYQKRKLTHLEFTGMGLPHTCDTAGDTDGTSALFGLAVWPQFFIRNTSNQEVVHQSQNDAATANGGYWFNGTLVGSRRTLKDNACFQTCAAMALTYLGVPCTPQALNTYLQNNRGYMREHIAVVASVSADTIFYNDAGSSDADWKLGDTFLIEHGPYNPIVTVAKDGVNRAHVVVRHQAGAIAEGDTGFSYRYALVRSSGLGFSNNQVRFRDLGNLASVPGKVEARLVDNLPVVLQSHNRSGGRHWVLADGWMPAFVSGTAARGTYRIKDPAYNKTRLYEWPFINEYDYARSVELVSAESPRRAGGIESASTVGSQDLTLMIRGHESVVITDPAGRGIFLDSATGVYDSTIPDALALGGWTDDDDEANPGTAGTGVDIFEIQDAMDGQYLVRIVGDYASISACGSSELGVVASNGVFVSNASGGGKIYAVNYAAATGGLGITFVGTVGVEPGGQKESGLLRVLETPARGIVRFAVDLTQSAGRVLEIYDVSGRKIDLLALGDSPSGLRVVTWDPATSGSGPGIYFARLRGRLTHATARFVLIR